MKKLYSEPTVEFVKYDTVAIMNSPSGQDNDHPFEPGWEGLL